MNNGYVILSSGTNAYAKHIVIEDTLIVRKNVNLTVSNSLGVGILNLGYFTNKGTVSFYNTVDDAMHNHSKLINYAEGTITISSTAGGIENALTGSIKNSGVIFADDCPGYGIISEGNVINKEGGQLNLYFTKGLGALGPTTNQGTINIISSNYVGILSPRDPFINDITGVINIEDSDRYGIYINGYFTNKGEINISNTAEEGIQMYLGTLTNTKKGKIYISDTGERGLEMIQISHVINKGLLQIDGTIGLEALWLGLSSSIENNGNLILNTSAPCAIDTISFFYNQPCGTFLLEGPIVNDNFFENEGWLRTSLNGTHTNNHLFFNEAVIEDINGSFDGVGINNNAIRIAPLNTTGVENVPIPNALDLGSLAGFQISNNKWYTDPALTTEAGDYDPVLNEFTPTANAVGISKFFLRVADLNNNCREVFYIEISGGVIAAGPAPPPSGPSVGSPAIKADFSLPYAIDLYPNPALEGFTINASAPLSREITVAIYDLQGRMIERRYFEAEGQTAVYFKLTSAYFPGLYLIKIQEEGQPSISRRLTILDQ